MLGATLEIAGGTGNIRRDKGVMVSGGAGTLGTGTGEDSDDRFTDPRRQVHRTGIVGQQQIDATEKGRQLFQFRRTGQISDFRSGSSSL